MPQTRSSNPPPPENPPTEVESNQLGNSTTLGTVNRFPNAIALDDLVQRIVHRHNGGLVSAHVFMAKTWVAGSADAWNLAHWRRRHKRRYLARLRGLGTWTAD